MLYVRKGQGLRRFGRLFALALLLGVDGLVASQASAQGCERACPEAEHVPQGWLLHVGTGHLFFGDELADGRALDVSAPQISLGLATQWVVARASVVRAQVTLVGATDAEKQGALIGLLDGTIRFVDPSLWFLGLGPVLGLGTFWVTEFDAPRVGHTVARGLIGGRLDLGVALSGSELAGELLVLGSPGEATVLFSLGARLSTEL